MLPAAALNAPTTHEHDFVMPYVNDLKNVIDMDAIRGAGLKLGVDPLGGASHLIGSRSMRSMGWISPSLITPSIRRFLS